MARDVEAKGWNCEWTRMNANGWAVRPRLRGAVGAAPRGRPKDGGVNEGRAGTGACPYMDQPQAPWTARACSRLSRRGLPRRSRCPESVSRVRTSFQKRIEPGETVRVGCGQGTKQATLAAAETGDGLMKECAPDREAIPDAPQTSGRPDEENAAPMGGVTPDSRYELYLRIDRRAVGGE